MRLVPRAPTRGHAAALVRSLADTLTDRRMVVPGKEAAPWKGEERRTPRRPNRAEMPAACSL
jgi:hypothetical protein